MKKKKQNLLKENNIRLFFVLCKKQADTISVGKAQVRSADDSCANLTYF